MKKNNLCFHIQQLSLENDELMLNETLFHNANGYIGVRSNFEEGYPTGYLSIRGQYINGFYDIAEMKQAEKLYGLAEEKQTMLNVVDTQGIKLYIDGEQFSMFDGEVVESSRTLDMAKGWTMREVLWRSPKKQEVRITVKRMASFAILPLFTIEYEVESVNFTGELRLVSTHIGNVQNYFNPNDPRVAGETFQHILPVSEEIAGDTSLLVSKTSKSQLEVASAVRHVCSKAGKERQFIEDSTAIYEMTTGIAIGEKVSFIKYSILADSIRFADCRADALRLMKRASSMGLARLYEEQEKYLTEYWENSAVNIYGDDELSMAVYFNLYQLIQSVGKDAYSNIAAKGLSGEGYEGHYFWDTEMYMMPFFSLTNPEIAKSLIQFRYNLLDGARAHARIMGHVKGALYPWRTIMGQECSGYFPSGSAQYHINGDIAYAIITYYLLTKDTELMLECGAELMFETARLWLDAGHESNGKFYIHEVTGPDEYTCLVNNNYYTNVLAQYHLQWAVKFYQLLQERDAEAFSKVVRKIGLTEAEVKGFQQAADRMYLPYDEELDINPQDDSFLSKKVWDLANTPKDKFPLLLHYHPLHLYRHQVCKQPDTVLAHFILEDAQSSSTIRNSFEYYEKVTTHDSSLSTCIFSIMASKLGLRDKAYEYFGESSKLDLFNTHKNTKDGIHAANLGGTYMAIVYGFGGLRVKEKGLFIAPALPDQWEGYDFKIRFEDSLIQVKVQRYACEVQLLKGTAKEIHVYGEKRMLQDRLQIELR